MKTPIVHTDDPSAIPRALEVLHAGGLVAFPTDTVYGLGASAFNVAAIEHIYHAKERPREKAIPVLLGDARDLERVAAAMGEVAQRLAARFWPGPLTLVVPKHPSLPSILSPHPTVGVRMPDHPFALTLLRAAGPLAVTSANRSGRPSPVTADEVRAQLDGRIDLILDGGGTPGGVPSTVVNCVGADVVVLRQGPIDEAQIRAAITGRVG